MPKRRFAEQKQRPAEEEIAKWTVAGESNYPWAVSYPPREKPTPKNLKIRGETTLVRPPRPKNPQKLRRKPLVILWKNPKSPRNSHIFPLPNQKPHKRKSNPQKGTIEDNSPRNHREKQLPRCGETQENRKNALLSR